ncbi:MAG: phosphotransferase family protein [Micrococcus sp.]|nr:phosphotransferase family protein [Micrococcus sp.]
MTSSLPAVPHHESSAADSPSIPGLDVDAFTTWCQADQPGLGTPRDVRLLTGGASNITLAFTSDRGPLVLRRPPLGHVMATAHDMSREYRVLSALADTGVPVPRTLFQHDDTDGRAGVGQPFFIMEFVEGLALTDRDAGQAVPEQHRHGLSLDLARVLADLHTVDPREVGLADFGRPAGFLARQAQRWNRQLTASTSRELPDLDRLGTRLLDTAPEPSGVGIVHGDYKFNNTLVRTTDESTIVAVLDWEMSTLGDPLTDLATLGIYWDMPEISEATRRHFATPVDQAAGYAAFDDLAAEYVRRRGLPGLELDWYLAMAAFKVAVIVESLHFRFRQGKAVGEESRYAGEMTEPLAALGLRHLAAWERKNGGN